MGNESPSEGKARRDIRYVLHQLSTSTHFAVLSIFSNDKAVYDLKHPSSLKRLFNNSSGKFRLERLGWPDSSIILDFTLIFPTPNGLLLLSKTKYSGGIGWDFDLDSETPIFEDPRDGSSARRSDSVYRSGRDSSSRSRIDNEAAVSRVERFKTPDGSVHPIRNRTKSIVVEGCHLSRLNISLYPKSDSH
jgi:hypothetical protein